MVLNAYGNKLKNTFGSSVTYYQGSILKVNAIVLNGERRAAWNRSSSRYKYDYKVKDNRH